MLIPDLYALTNLPRQDTLATVATVLNAHHTLVTLLSIEQLCNHNVALLCTVVRKRVRFTNLTAVYVSVDIREDNMVVA